MCFVFHLWESQIVPFMFGRLHTTSVKGQVFCLFYAAKCSKGLRKLLLMAIFHKHLYLRAFFMKTSVFQKKRNFRPTIFYTNRDNVQIEHMGTYFENG